MKKIIFIFLTCFSLVLISFSFIYSFDNYRSFIPGMSSAGQHLKTDIPEPVILFFLGIAMIVLAGCVKRKFLKRI